MKYFLTADDICEILGIGKQKAYKIIREINNELKAQGYMIVQGRVNKKRFFEKVGIKDASL